MSSTHEKNRPEILALLSGALILGASGCATTTSKTVDQKLAQEPAIQSQAQASAMADQKIENAPNLTAEQRSKLGDLKTSVRAKSQALETESLRYRALLVDEVLSSNYKPNEVAHIKKHIKDIENQRLNALFDAVDQANKILGREAERSRQYVSGIFFDRGGSAND